MYRTTFVSMDHYSNVKFERKFIPNEYEHSQKRFGSQRSKSEINWPTSNENKLINLKK